MDLLDEANFGGFLGFLLERKGHSAIR